MAGRMGLKSEQLAEQMSRQGTNAKVVKSRIRADMVWGRLVRGRFSSTLTVGERDILQAIESKNVAEKDTTGYEYVVRPILFLVPEGSSQSAYDSRRREAEAFRARFQNCDAGVNLARALRDVAVREKIVRTSGDIPAQMRTTLDNLELGRLTPPEQTKYGLEMFALCEKVATRADSPLKKEARDAIFNEKFEKQAKSYLANIRRSAMIEYK
jgi:peptidyl-prolyl cis-trans isomerase SurA